MKTIFGRLSSEGKAIVLRLCILFVSFLVGMIFGIKFRKPTRIFVLDGSLIV